MLNGNIINNFVFLNDLNTPSFAQQIAWSGSKLMRIDMSTLTIVWSRVITSGYYSIKNAFVSLSSKTIFVISESITDQSEKFSVFNYDTGLKSEPPSSKRCPALWETVNVRWETSYQTFVCIFPYEGRIMVNTFTSKSTLTWNATGSLYDTIFTKTHLIMMLSKSYDIFCTVNLRLENYDEQWFCPKNEFGVIGIPYSRMKLTTNGDRVFSTWSLLDNFRFQNQIFPRGNYFFEITLDSEADSDLTSTVKITQPTFASLPNTPIEDTSTLKTIAIISISIGILVGFMFILTVFLYFRLRFRRARRKDKITSEDTNLTIVSASAKHTISTMVNTHIPLAIPAYLEAVSSSFRTIKSLAQPFF